MRIRKRSYSLLADFESSNRLVFSYGRECIEKDIKRIAGFQILEEVVDRHARPNENGLSAHDLWIAVNDFVRHGPRIPRMVKRPPNVSVA